MIRYVLAAAAAATIGVWFFPGPGSAAPVTDAGLIDMDARPTSSLAYARRGHIYYHTLPPGGGSDTSGTATAETVSRPAAARGDIYYHLLPSGDATAAASAPVAEAGSQPASARGNIYYHALPSEGMAAAAAAPTTPVAEVGSSAASPRESMYFHDDKGNIYDTVSRPPKQEDAPGSRHHDPSTAAAATAALAAPADTQRGGGGTRLGGHRFYCTCRPVGRPGTMAKMCKPVWCWAPERCMKEQAPGGGWCQRPKD